MSFIINPYVFGGGGGADPAEFQSVQIFSVLGRSSQEGYINANQVFAVLGRSSQEGYINSVQVFAIVEP